MRRLIVLITLLLTACNSMSVIPTASPIPNINPTSTLQLPRPTLQALPICPSLNTPSHVVPPSEVSILWMKETINDYLNQGGNPEKLVNQITSPEFDNLQVKMNRVDINSDGIDELIFSSGIVFSANNISGVDSGFWIFQCEDDTYKIIYQIELLGSYEGNPRLITAVDLNNDGRQEIVIRSTWRGSGCLQYFQVISWEKDNNNPTQRLNDENFPCNTEFAIGNEDNNGNKEVLFKGETNIRYDSVAGIQRNFIDTYVLNQDMYVLKSHIYLPSPYRIYSIYDAQRAFNIGDIYQAIQFYEQSAYDDTLKDIDSVVFSSNFYVEKWPENLSKQDYPKEYVSAFSLFRLVLLYFQVNEEDKAILMLRELETKYPSEKVGSEFTEATQIFVEHFKSGETPLQACKAVSSMIEEKYPFLDWHFKWSTWTVFEYTNQTLCPYFSYK